MDIGNMDKRELKKAINKMNKIVITLDDGKQYAFETPEVLEYWKEILRQVHSKMEQNKEVDEQP